MPRTKLWLRLYFEGTYQWAAYYPFDLTLHEKCGFR